MIVNVLFTPSRQMIPIASEGARRRTSPGFEDSSLRDQLEKECSCSSIRNDDPTFRYPGVNKINRLLLSRKTDRLP